MAAKGKSRAGEDEMIIRKMTPKDLEPLYGLLSDSRAMEHIEPVYSFEKTEAFLSSAGLSEPPLIYAVDEGGCFVGYVIYHDYDKDSVEIGWVLCPDYWGKGYASKLTARMVKMAKLAGKKVVIECSPEQLATKHIAEKFGFRYVGNIDALDVYRLGE